MGEERAPPPDERAARDRWASQDVRFWAEDQMKALAREYDRTIPLAAAS